MRLAPRVARADRRRWANPAIPRLSSSARCVDSRTWSRVRLVAGIARMRRKTNASRRAAARTISARAAAPPRLGRGGLPGSPAPIPGGPRRHRTGLVKRWRGARAAPIEDRGGHEVRPGSLGGLGSSATRLRGRTGQPWAQGGRGSKCEARAALDSRPGHPPANSMPSGWVCGPVHAGYSSRGTPRSGSPPDGIPSRAR